MTLLAVHCYHVKVDTFTEKTGSDVAPVARGLDERLLLIRLLDTYGSLLTLRQRRTMRLYYLDDLSLGEIAERQGVTRQAVRDSLQRSIVEMRRYERHLGLVRDGADPRRRGRDDGAGRR